MKKRLAFFMGLILLTAAVGVSAEDVQETDTEAPLWTDYQIQIDRQIYKFPMKYRTFEAYGWSGGVNEGTMEPYQYARYIFTREDESCSAYLLNLSVETSDLTDCIVAGIVIEEHDWKDSDAVITLPGGLVRGESTSEDIVEAYGEPDSLTEGSLYTIYTYSEDTDREVELEVYNKTDILENIRIENFAEPKGYDTGGTGGEVPDEILAYTRPASLSESLNAYEIELDGQVYSLPVPVRTLMEDGWMLREEESDPQVPAQYYGWVTLQKGDLTFTQIVINHADDAAAPQNCWIETLQIGADALDADGRLPGGLKVGMSEKKLLSTLAKNEMPYTVTEQDGQRIYVYNEEGYGHSTEVTVEDKKITAIACENVLE